MSYEQIALLALASFAGGLAFGVTGFAFGVVASLFLHHAFAPREVVFLIVSGGLLLNLLALPRFWREIDFRQSAPFLTGATVGLPLGILLLQRMPPANLRLLTSVVVIAYCLFALLRHGQQALQFSRRSGQAADTGIGLAGGVIGGVAGLGPLLPSVWYGLRGKNKAEARGLTQPFGLYVQGLMTAWFLVTSGAQQTPLAAVALGLPLMLAGAWIGLRLFERISVATFRLCIVWLSLAGAVILLVRQALAYT